MCSNGHLPAFKVAGAGCNVCCHLGSLANSFISMFFWLLSRSGRFCEPGVVQSSETLLFGRDEVVAMCVIRKSESTLKST